MPGRLPGNLRTGIVLARGLHRHFALELVHVPAAGADRRADAEWSVLRYLSGEVARDLEMAALRSDPVDETGCERFFGRKKPAGQDYLRRPCAGTAEIHQCAIFSTSEAARGLGHLKLGVLGQRRSDRIRGRYRGPGP